jgi:aspartyl-tRNA(Asn)/glutamyl-tRNA(Gln) amidotransferase subunit A
VRLPAAINGIVGLKPTFGRVSKHGVVPLSASLDHVGPMTRTVTDSALVLQAIAGHDRNDPTSINVPVPDYGFGIENGASGLVVGVEREHHLYSGVSDDAREATEAALELFRRNGARIVEINLSDLDLADAILTVVLLMDASSCYRRLLREQGGDLHPDTRRFLTLGELIPATHYVTALRARQVLRGQIQRAFSENRLDALLSPTLPLTSVPIDEMHQPQSSGETPMEAYGHHLAAANLVGLPALAVPAGLSRDGLPVSLQLLGHPFGESRLLRLARAYEREHVWHQLTPPIGRQPSTTPDV